MLVRRLVVALAVSLGIVSSLAGPRNDLAAAGLAAGETAGALVIVGGGGLPNVIRDRFLELAGGRKARLVVIPTASMRADRPEALKSFAFWKSQDVASVKLLHTRDPKQANDPEFVKPLAEATGVWLSGGDQSRLVAAYHGTQVEHELQQVLARGGVIGGTSAGAAVMSSLMIQGGNPMARLGQGFGFLTGMVVDQHFFNRNRLNRLLDVLARNPSYLGLGIDEQTAVVVKGHTLTVLGERAGSTLPSRTGPPAAAGTGPQNRRTDRPGGTKLAVGSRRPFPHLKRKTARRACSAGTVSGGAALGLIFRN